MSLFHELQRRNVLRVAGLYLAVGWLVMQATDVLASLLGLPQWVGALVVTLLALGFPAALILSWLFETTPDGVRRDDGISTDPALHAERARKLNLLVLGAVGLVLLVVIADRLVPEMPTQPSPAETAAVNEISVDNTVAPTAQDDRPTEESKAIAVLPFVNLSSDPEQEFLADGITEEILNLLGNVQGLKVTSRTSSFSFKGQLDDLPTIGRKLGVRHVVEGSVRTQGDNVRITAQLIDVGSDAHIWSSSYDRKLDDVFAIQSDVAQQITRVLGAALSTDEMALIGERPTQDLGAWQSYLAARDAFLSRTMEAAPSKAMELADEALRVDPGFARAVSLRAQMLLEQAQSFEDLGAAFDAAGHALDLNPQLGEPHYALARIAYLRGNFAQAYQHYRQAVAAAPNNAEGRISYGKFLVGAGYRSRGFQEAQRAAELDPLSPANMWSAAYIALAAGRMDAVEAFSATSQENGWVDIQATTLAAGAAAMRGDFDVAEARFIDALPSRAAQLKASFDAIRQKHIDSETRAMLEALWPYGPPGLARFPVYILAGDVDDAFEAVFQYQGLLEQARINQANFWSALYGDPLRPDWWFTAGARFRQDPRFAEFMGRLGMVDFWRSEGWPDLCAQYGESLVCQ